MASAAIDTRRLVELPSVCVKTGVFTERVKSQAFGDLPAWTFLLIFWGLLPFLIASGFARRKVRVSLPIAEEVLHRLRLVDLGSIAGLLSAIGLLFAALLGWGSAWAWSGLALALVTLVGGAVARNLVWVTGRLDGDVLWLFGVHPAFADEVETLAPQHPGPRGSSGRWVTVLLVATIMVFGVILFLMFSLRA